MDDEVYNNQCNKIRKNNSVFLELFEKDMIALGLSERTIRRHMSNVDSYINGFLILYDIHTMEDGLHMLSEYLGDFFIRKDRSSTPATIKTVASRIKKLYQCMLEHGKIKKEDYNNLCWVIRDEMELWQEECAVFNGN